MIVFPRLYLIRVSKTSWDPLIDTVVFDNFSKNVVSSIYYNLVKDFINTKEVDCNSLYSYWGNTSKN